MVVTNEANHLKKLTKETYLHNLSIPDSRNQCISLLICYL